MAAGDDLFTARQSLNLSQIVGDGGNPREIQRRQLIDKVGEKISGIIVSYDQVKEASHLAASVETAVAQTALLEVGAVVWGAGIYGFAFHHTGYYRYGGCGYAGHCRFLYYSAQTLKSQGRFQTEDCCIT